MAGFTPAFSFLSGSLADGRYCHLILLPKNTEYFVAGSV